MTSQPAGPAGPITNQRSPRLPRGTVLVVDDEESVRLSLCSILEGTYDVLEAADGRQALDILGTDTVDLVLLDQRMPGESGIDVLQHVKAIDPTIVVVLATAVRDLKTAVEAIKRGAYDYITKPFDVEEIVLLVHRALEKRALEREVLCLRSELAPARFTGSDSFRGIIGRHPEMVNIYQRIDQVASTPTTVLITGESGTGKELVARAIHHHSSRATQPFVAFNVAAFPDSLIDAELFGYEKGAFTGATARKLGKFELAQGGTVFLDEIASLRADLQTKLLRVLQEREVERLGGVQPTAVDVRVLAATNTDLRKAVKEGTFREDFFYRLNVLEIHLPPLRERREDIPLLVDHFVRKIARECSKDVRGISPGARDLLSRYAWPGNIRELENVIHRAVVLARDVVLQLDDFPLDVAMPQARSGLAEDTGLSLKDACEQFERQYVLRALDRVQWNVSGAARMLGVHRNTIITKLCAWGLHRPGSSGDRAAAS
jgi:two-component system, NtrC family, response regulator AtoC